MKKLLLACALLFINSSFAQPFTFTEFDLSPGITPKGPGNFNIVGGKLLFTATDTAHGGELWVTDGTIPGTQIIKDITAGKNGSNPTYFAFLNNRLYFSAFDTTIGRELWVTDGTDTGTHPVKDINTGKSNAQPQETITYNGRLIFAAIDSTVGYELWISDGTDTGTHLLKDIYPGQSNSSYPNNFVIFNNKVYFTASTATGKDLWCTDGTTNGTQQVSGIYTGSSLYLVKAALGKLFMIQYTSPYNMEVWVTDGTPVGTKLLMEAYPGPNFGISMMYMTEYNGKVLILTPTPFAIGTTLLYITDGTPAGTQLLKSMPYKSSYLIPADFCEFDNKMYFAGATGSGLATETTPALWVTDGTVAGTKQIINKATNKTVTHPSALTVYNNYLYFTGTIQGGGSRHLMRYDGTDTGIIVVSPPSPQLNPLNTYSPLIVYDSALYYAANYTGRGRLLWRVKDTNTRLIITPPPGNVATTAGNAELTIYPNPNTGKFTITFSEALLSAGMVRVYDIAGREIYSKQIAPGEKRTDIMLDDAPAGLYYITMHSGDDTQTGVIHISR